MLKTYFSIINLKRLAELSKIPYMKIRNTIAIKEPLYNTLSENEKTQISNHLFIEVQKIFKDLGRTIKIS